MDDFTSMPFGFAPNVQQPKSPPFRPFKAGEKIQNPDGSYSTEVTVTVGDGKGGWMVIPQLWMGPNGIVDLRGKPDLAASAAMHLRDNFGMNFPTFKSIRDADAFAMQRSESGGASHGSIAKRVK